jgi:hypothetical protein
MMPNKCIKQCFVFGEWNASQFILFLYTKPMRDVMALQITCALLGAL